MFLKIGAKQPDKKKPWLGARGNSLIRVHLPFSSSDIARSDRESLAKILAEIFIERSGSCP
jgi:hypothetical protein